MRASLLDGNGKGRSLLHASLLCLCLSVAYRNTQFVGLDIFWRSGRLPREGVRAKKFGMSLRTQGNKFFGSISQDFGWDISVAPDKFERKFCVQSLAPSLWIAQGICSRMKKCEDFRMNGKHIIDIQETLFCNRFGLRMVVAFCLSKGSFWRGLLIAL